MAGLRRTLTLLAVGSAIISRAAEKAALATLDELAGKSERTLVERDSAVLRLIYSYEAVWKACQKVLAALENVSAASPTQ